MIVVCKGWNGAHADERVLGVKAPLEDPRKSDTACRDCRKAILAELREVTRGIENAAPQR